MSIIVLIRTDRGAEYKGKPEHHEYELYLQIESIDHTKTQVRHPQTNGICERFHRTMQEEFYAVTFRKKLYDSIENLQNDLDIWMEYYGNERPHSGRYCFGKTPMQTFTESLPLAKEKLQNDLHTAAEYLQFLILVCQIKSCVLHIIFFLLQTHMAVVNYPYFFIIVRVKVSILQP